MKTKIIEIKTPSDAFEAVEEARKALMKGYIISFPTETVYALAAGANIPGADELLFELKGRPKVKPFSLMVSSKGMINGLVKNISETARRLINRCLPGPLTLILETENSTVGIRMPADKIALDIIDSFGAPLISTSANLAGAPPAVSGKEVIREFDGKIGLIVDAGDTKYKTASTVVRVSGERWQILRKGALSELALRRSSNKIILFLCAGNTCRSPLAEGICRKHLCERLGVTPLELEDNGYTLISAGVSTAGAMPASENAILASRELGFDLESHLSQKVTKEMVETVDKIYIMEGRQAEALRELSDQGVGKIEILDPNGMDIIDPAGGALEDYRMCASKIESAVKERIRQL